MALSTGKKVALGIAGTVITVILGAVGSGVWELLFSPLVSWLGRLILSVFTLGIESARDGIYQEIAKGHHELPSLFVYLFLTTLMLIFPIAVTLPVFFLDRLDRSLKAKSAEEREILKYRMRRLLLIMTVVLVLLGSSIYVRFVMHNYVNLTITHFEQCMNIVGPFLDVREEKQLLSEFANIKNKDDFITLISKVKNIARANNKQLPEFSVW